MIKHCLRQNGTSIVIQSGEIRSLASFILSLSFILYLNISCGNFFQGGDQDPQNLMSSYKAREDPAKPCVDNFDTICPEVDNYKNR